MRIAIVGGGVGGITAALALGRRGFEVEVLEQATRIDPVGASLQLGPNAMRLLAELGLLPALRTVGVRPDAVDFVRWEDGSLLLHTELGEAAERHFGAPQLDFFRPDLHRVLVDALPAGVLRLGVRVDRVEQDEAGVTLVRASGEEIRADAVVAADGINSRLRQQLWGADEPVFSNTVVYRGVVPRAAVEQLHPDRLNLYWLGPYRHGVAYWIADGTLLAMNCAVQDAEWSQESWTLETDPEEAAEAFAGWDPRLVERIRLVTTSLRGAVFVRSGLEHWSIGRVTLLGDAAHAMEPFQAQGAAQAVEDAYVLATCVAAHDGEGTPRASTRTSIGSLAGCHACERNENIPALPNWDRALVTDHWRLAHAWSALPGWLVLLPLRHVKALDELTNREAAEIGPLLRTTTAALRDVVGCTKSYVMLFAELEGHEHLHFHIVPRMPEFTDEQIGARVFTFLRRPESEWVPEPQRNRLAREIGALVRTRLERLS